MLVYMGESGEVQVTGTKTWHIYVQARDVISIFMNFGGPPTWGVHDLLISNI